MYKKQKEIIIGKGMLKKPGEKPKKFLRTLSIDRQRDITITWVFREEENDKILDGKRAK